MNERFYYLAFSLMYGVGPTKFQLLLNHFGTAKAAFNAKEKELIKIGLGEKLTNKFIQFRDTVSIEDYLNKLEKSQTSFICLKDTEYPEGLRQIKNPPFVLFVKGNGKVLSNSSLTIGVVGTRKTTYYGREVTHLISQQLVESGVIIVSGLAMGVDAIAHQVAVDYKSPTIAVLGCGVDCCTPSVNLALYNSIVSGNGCVISELPLSHPPTKGSFPSRNRIIAGLSSGVVVTEGAEDSGSLITADFAFKFNRKVFAVPGPITSGMSKGPLKLLRKGAVMVASGEDIMNQFQINTNSKFPISNKKKVQKITSREEQKILEFLENESLTFDEIVKGLKLNPSTIGSLLSIMEIKGLIKSSSSGSFSIAT